MQNMLHSPHSFSQVIMFGGLGSKINGSSSKLTEKIGEYYNVPAKFISLKRESLKNGSILEIVSQIQHDTTAPTLIAGISFGGWLAMKLHSKCPENFPTCVVVNPFVNPHRNTKGFINKPAAWLPFLWVYRPIKKISEHLEVAPGSCPKCAAIVASDDQFIPLANTTDQIINSGGKVLLVRGGHFFKPTLELFTEAAKIAEV